jgi:hypothetical protein
MKYSEKQYVNRLLAIIDACNTTALINIQFNGYADEILAVKNLHNDKFNIELTPENKNTIIKVLSENMNDFDFCHYWFRKDNKIIAEGFDHCEINFFSPDYFDNSKQLIENLQDVEFGFTYKFSSEVPPE